MESPARNLLNTILDRTDEFLSQVHLPIGDHLGQDRSSSGITKNEMLALFMVIRSLGWCHAARRLIAEGYCEEAITLIRGAFERLIVAYEWASTYCHTPANQIPEVEPQRLVGKFKKFFPPAGKLYGNISEITHYSPALFKDAFSRHDGFEVRVNFVYTPEAKPIESISTALLLYSQVDLCASLSDWIIARTKDKTEHWIRSDQTDLPASECQHQVQLLHWMAEMEKIAESRKTDFI
jgi:hypothetical protein